MDTRDQDRQQALTGVLVEFARTLGTPFSVQQILDHLVQRITDVLPVTAAGVMVRTEGDRLRFVAAGDRVIRRIETLQDELGDGPCLHAYRTGRPVSMVDLATDDRFDGFAREARAAGMRAVFSFPLRGETGAFGALDLYRDRPGPLAEDDLRAAQTLADVAAAYLVNAQARLGLSTTLVRLNHQNLHDPLTGLPNRPLLHELTVKALARAGRADHQVALLVFDLDHFKRVNDRLGHPAGDELLRAVATRLSGALRASDTLARLGGDEFVLLCEGLHGQAEADLVAERVAACLAAPFVLAGREVAVGASIGIALSGPGRGSPDELFRDADAAMYDAKAAGGRCVRRSAGAPEGSGDRRAALERDLVEPDAHERLGLVYQPVLDVRSGTLVGVEALLRWEDPDGAGASPEDVVATAERTGTIDQLGRWVLQRACRDLRDWRRRGLRVPTVAVNVSAHQVVGGDFVRTVAAVVGAAGLRPADVVLEVTESVFLADAPRAVEVLRRVRDLGVGLAVDDFGTGYSSFGYLSRYPFDAVKIDRSFVADLVGDEVTRSVVTAMVDLSHSLGLTVTAEGVESARDLAAVTAVGADRVQGFFLGRPLGVEEVVDFLQRPLPGRRRPGMVPVPGNGTGTDIDADGWRPARAS